MKKLLLTSAAVAALCSTATSADLGEIGLDGSFGFYTDKTTNTPDEGDETFDKEMYRAMYLKPRLTLEVSERMALVPYIGVGFETNREKVDDGTTETKTDNVRMILGGGFGLDYTLIEEDWFAMSSGPRANFKMTTSGHEYDPDEFADLNFGVDLPLYLNFTFSDTWGVRLTSQVVDLSMGVYKVKEKGADTVSKSTTPSFTILGSDFDGFKYVPFELGVYFQF